jgi:uncharacterized protein YjbI with pentapeptide repeats
MAVRSDVDWKTCDEDECVGVRLPSGGRCWEHADAHDMDAALERLGEGGDFDGRGVVFRPGRLETILDAVSDDKGRAVVPDARFDGATFTFAVFTRATFKGTASFKRATFTPDATVAFDGATFNGDASFDGATFARNASFDVATFNGDASFRGATFNASAGFDGASFNGRARFHGATFDGGTFGWRAAKFARATFKGTASFDGATFKVRASFGLAVFGIVSFKRATFKGTALFSSATFARNASFNGVTFNGDASFGGATFERPRQLGPMVVREKLVLDGALFHERIQIEVVTPALCCERTRFLAGVQLRVRRAQVVMDDADLAAPSVLTGARPFPDLEEGDWPRVPGDSWPVDPYGTPRLLSVRGADVAGLTVAAVDLRACRFVDAHHLDQLRAEGSNFANTPPGWRWTKRRTIAEEHQWRASEEDGQGWYEVENQPPDWLEVKELTPGQAGLLLPGEIAPLYRQLRKGLEDSKDEPGAADFYYGEMEMRRHDKRQQLHLERILRFRNGSFGISAAAEWAILTLYWLVSGYGLRAWRALASLTAVVLVASVIFAFWGFAAAAGWGDLRPALIHSAQATTALLRGPDPRRLTDVGEWTQIALRLIGPVLLGLAVLSVRGRVKR